MHDFTGAIALTGAAFGEARAHFLLSAVNCSGSEPNLLNCTVVQRVDTCGTPFQDAGVICQGWLLVVQLCCTLYMNFASSSAEQLGHFYEHTLHALISLYMFTVLPIACKIQIPPPLKEAVVMVTLG